jgi:uncharacterized membrane protein
MRRVPDCKPDILCFYFLRIAYYRNIIEIATLWSSAVFGLCIFPVNTFWQITHVWKKKLSVDPFPVSLSIFHLFIYCVCERERKR